MVAPFCHDGGLAETTVRSLAMHAAYRCRNAGACCSSNWPIPIEADRLLALQAAMAHGRVRPVSAAVASAVHTIAAAPSDAAGLLGRSEQACVFYDAGATGGRCCIQSGLGHDALPLACRQFPRVSVLDPRGVSVTLSHYCPTAAALLDTAPDAAAAILTNAPAFPANGEYVGLDARQALPPLLKPNLLMDWDAWWECERLAVESFSDARDVDPDVALTRLRTAVADVQQWSPADGPLIDRVSEAFARAAQLAPSAQPASRVYVDAVFRAIPTEIRPARFAEAVATSKRATRRFLAAHAFANWSIHSEQGLGMWMRSIDAAAALLTAGAGVRHADLLLRHLADTDKLHRDN